MSKQKASGGSQSRQSAGNLSEEDQTKQRAGAKQKSSQNSMSRQKAGSHEGAGGGAKQGYKKGS